MQKSKVKAFVDRWRDKGYEKGQSQIFWVELLTDVLGVQTPSEIISFEDQVKLDHTSFIDAYIQKTHVMIEQKSIDKDLLAPIKQSDGSTLTPFQQAKRYSSELPYSLRPRWIVTCNFKSFHVYDMENPQGEPLVILLENLEKDFHLLNFLVDNTKQELKHEMEVSIKAGGIVGQLYEALLAQFGDVVTDEDLHSLNVLCVRLVFCLYAEDAGIFEKDQFVKYLQTFQPEDLKMAIENLFKVLDTPVDKRDRFLPEKLKAFPYVNGSLFKQQECEVIPPFTIETANVLILHASLEFDWSPISPTIFGAVFESTLNQDTRRKGGMHYTSIENIHKVIDPLFMESLIDEFEKIKGMPNGKQRIQQLTQFQDKLASLKFLDPACGSGNFLTETYISLRRLENKVIASLTGGQAMMGIEEYNPIKVNIHQFYGIEINDFAVTVATTALWIAENQMMEETEKIIKFNNDFLPLKSYANIKEGNALRIDWKYVVDPNELNYIIGNPPFVGYSLQSEAQKEDLLSIYVDEKGKPYKTAGKIDYVAGWYWKASKFMFDAYELGNIVRSALVSTNSITQGEQVASVWKPLYERFNIHIDFAWKTFRWDSETSLKAHVHCVIVAFSIGENKKMKKLNSTEGISKTCDNINAYLIDAPNCFVDSRTKTICKVPQMMSGNRPADGGYLIVEDSDYDDFISKDPGSVKYIKKLTGALEYINNKKRYCLWLVNSTPGEIKEMPLVYERIRLCKEDRENAPDPGRQKLASTPHLFREQLNPDSYLIVPRVSSESRKYIPIGYLNRDTIPTDSATIIPNATIYHFGILTSSVHMAWMRVVCGRLKSDYRYSKDIVYNNFPWPAPTEKQKEKIEQTAQSILDARALYPDSSLADLYDEITMPVELRKAHQANDKDVMEAYGFKPTMTESEVVAELFKMYSELVKS